MRWSPSVTETGDTPQNKLAYFHPRLSYFYGHGLLTLVSRTSTQGYYQEYTFTEKEEWEVFNENADFMNGEPEWKTKVQWLQQR